MASRQSQVAEVWDSIGVAPGVHPLMSCRTQLQWGRKLLHLSAAGVGLLLYGVLGCSRATILTVLGAWLMTATITELCRRRFPGFNVALCLFFAPIMRERERHRISSASWYIASMWMVFLLAPREVALIVLWLVGVGDTAAGVVGARWGRWRLTPHLSVEGMAAAFAVCFVGVYGMAGYWLPSLRFTGASLMAFVGLVALVGTLAESLFPHLDDNLVIPLLGAPTVWGLIQLFQ